MVGGAMMIDRSAFAAAFVISLAAAQSYAATADEGPYVLMENTFVCVSPTAYDEAIERAKTAPSKFKLAKQLTAEKLCVMVDDEDIEDMMAPFVKVTETDADMIKVQYEVEFYKRIEYLHRTFSRVVFTGWTHKDRLIPRSDLGKN